jgi:hypothetical protein
MSMKNSNDTIRNRTHDLPARSAVPQPTAPLRASLFPIEFWDKLDKEINMQTQDKEIDRKR